MYSQIMRVPLALFSLVLLVVPYASPQSGPSTTNDYSGMYSFLREGEFIQITIEDGGKVTGFISRYGDSESDRGAFLDQFLKSGKLESNRLSFTTENVHGTWFTFEGTVDRAADKKPDEEGLFVLRGKLTRFRTDTEKKVSQETQQVEFKSFPRDAAN